MIQYLTSGCENTGILLITSVKTVRQRRSWFHILKVLKWVSCIFFLSFGGLLQTYILSLVISLNLVHLDLPEGALMGTTGTSGGLSEPFPQTLGSKGRDHRRRLCWAPAPVSPTSREQGSCLAGLWKHPRSVPSTAEAQHNDFWRPRLQ